MDPRSSRYSGRSGYGTEDRRGYSSRGSSRTRDYGRSSRQDRYQRNAPTDPRLQAPAPDSRETPETTAPRARPARTRSAAPGGGSQSAETSVEVAKPTKSPGSPNAPSAAGRRGQPKQEETKPLVQWPTFYLDVNADQIILGDVFSVDINLFNPKKTGFSKLAAVIHYDPVFLRPVTGPAEEGSEPRVAASLIDEVTRAPVEKGMVPGMEKEKKPYIREVFDERITLYENVVDNEDGLLVYMFELDDETVTAQGRVASVYFEAIQPTRRTFLSFQFGEKKGEAETASTSLGTGLLKGEKDVLGLPLRPDDGTIDRGVTILAEKPEKERVRSLTEKERPGEFFSTHLALVPERRRIVVGEEFDVYVRLDNPNHVRFDQISLLVAYNPRVLELIDYDKENAITRGVNVHDGSYRDAFPFDYFIKNEIDPERGLVDYRMRGYRRPLRSEGVLASMRFRALKSTAETSLRIFLDRDGKDPTTGVFYRFDDVLGDSEDFTDGVSTCSVQIGRLRSVSAREGTEGAGGS